MNEYNHGSRSNNIFSVHSLTFPCQLIQLKPHACIIHIVINHKNNCSLARSSAKAFIQFRENGRDFLVDDVSRHVRQIVICSVQRLTTQTSKKAVNAP